MFQNLTITVRYSDYSDLHDCKHPTVHLGSCISGLLLCVFYCLQLHLDVMEDFQVL